MQDFVDTAPLGAPPAAPRPATRPHLLSIRFVGSGSEYFRIWIVNLLLTLLTLGFYYPFAKVRRLRYFHAATEIGGQPLGFHADPWKMLRGYLLAGGLVLLYSIAGAVSPIAGLIALVIVAAIWPALWHSALRFRMANTSWRGLRMHFAGSRAGAYRALALPVVLGLLLVGLVAWVAPNPADQAAGPPVALALVPLLIFASMPGIWWLIKRYQHGGYALGNERTRLEIGLGRFVGVVLLTFALLSLLVLVVVIVIAVFGAALGLRGRGGAAAGDGGFAFFGLLVFGMLVIALQAVGRAIMAARLQNAIWGTTRGASLRFTSALQIGPLAGVYLKNWLLMLITLGLYFPFAQVNAARAHLEAVAIESSIDPEELVSRGQRADEAAGDAAGDLLGIDMGL